jgi:penicillin amidase
MNRWGLPPENMVYADVDGNIGWKPGGLAPIRPNWDGLLPVPGDGRYEWAGFRDMGALPVEHNPARGWIATANHMNLPSDYPHALGFEWVLPYRYERIREVLGPGQGATLDDMLALQLDYRSVSAGRVVALLEGLDSPDPDVRHALGLLSDWDRSLGPTSAPAALYEVWFHRHLVPEVMAHQIDSEPTRKAVLDEGELYDMFEGSSVEVWLSLLEDLAAWRGPDPGAARSAVLLASLAAAIEETEGLLGNDWEEWSWGRLHTAHLRHPLSALLGEDARSRVDVGPAPRGGTGDTVNSTGYLLADFVQRWGASFRMVLDVGAWDESVAMNTPGQSGDPESRHYSDLFERWAADEIVPLVFARDRVEAAAEQRIVLRPAGP